MARSITEAAALYRPGQKHSWSINQLATTDRAEAKITVGADWPMDRSVAVLYASLMRDTGGGGWGIWNGDLENQDGSPRTVITLYVQAEPESDGLGGVRKKPFGGVTLTIEVYVPVTLSIQLYGV